MEEASGALILAYRIFNALSNTISHVREKILSTLYFGSRTVLICLVSPAILRLCFYLLPQAWFGLGLSFEVYWISAVVQ